MFKNVKMSLVYLSTFTLIGVLSIAAKEARSGDASFIRYSGNSAGYAEECVNEGGCSGEERRELHGAGSQYAEECGGEGFCSWEEIDETAGPSWKTYYLDQRQYTGAMLNAWCADGRRVYRANASGTGHAPVFPYACN